jgi:hypothetical protein
MQLTSTRIPVPAKLDVAAASLLTRAPFATLQRRCACGGSGSLSGECAECKKRKTLQHRVDCDGASPRFGHNFGQVRVHDATMAAASADAFRANSCLLAGQTVLRPLMARYSLPATNQVPVDAPEGTEDPDTAVSEDADMSATQQDGGDDSPANGNDGQGATALSDDPTFGNPSAGAPLCHNGGGASSCDFSSGEYKITSIDNTCCTADCTQQHEARHVQDLGDCCKKASDARKSSAAPDKVVNRYRQWLEQARPTTECNAYRNDVKCATALEKTNGCSGKGKDSACCLSISSYKSRYGELAEKFCKGAPTKIPDCPNFDLATLLP